MRNPDDLWRSRVQCPDMGLMPWLTDRGSLTARIQRRCQDFNVRVLRQSPARPFQDERALVGVRGGARGMVREVSLNSGTRPLVFAHSVLARGALRGPWRRVAGLGRRPLGAALFSDPRIARRPLRFRKLSANDALFRRAAALLGRPPRALWARRSLFVARGMPLLVTEVFLPAILDLPR